MDKYNLFKKCNCCNAEWPELSDFVEDKELVLVGYQETFKDGIEGLFFVDHVAEGCGTTLAIKEGRFKNLYNGPVYHKLSRNKGDCEGKCLRYYDLDPCKVECKRHWIRETMQVLRRHGEKSEPNYRYEQMRKQTMISWNRCCEA